MTRPVDMPVAREHGLSGHLLRGTDLRLETTIGRGATALVYRATRARGSPVAVKVLHLHSEDSVRERFNREARILRWIDSPEVVKMAGKGVLEDGRAWYSMEYVDGQSLAEILVMGSRSDPARVVEWLRSACRGLAAIHDAGWVHRDVKPGNLVVVSVDGREVIKVIDLGIAERIHASLEMLSGTPDYIAPEQAEFRSVDVRSDVYGLGCCAYELLSGRRLVEEGTIAAKIQVHREGVCVRWPLGQAIPYALRRLVERCLAREPDERPPNMHALQAELERLAPALVGMDISRDEPLLQSEYRATTELGFGWPNAASKVPECVALAVVQPRDRSWSSLAKTILSALTPRMRSV